MADDAHTTPTLTQPARTLPSPVRLDPPDRYGGATARSGLGYPTVLRHLEGLAPTGTDLTDLAHHVCGLTAGILRARWGVDLDWDAYGVDGLPGLLWHASSMDGWQAYTETVRAAGEAVARLRDGWQPPEDGPGWQQYCRAVGRHADGLDWAARMTMAQRERGTL